MILLSGEGSQDTLSQNNNNKAVKARKTSDKLSLFSKFPGACRFRLLERMSVHGVRC